MPRDPQRIPVLLDLIRAEWEREPDLRLGQLLLTAVHVARGRPPKVRDVFYVEDDRLIEEFRKSAKRA